MTNHTDNQPPAPRPRSWRTTIFWLIAAGAFLPTAFGFIQKFVRLVEMRDTIEGGQFTIFPVLNYALVAIGFTCLLIWAAARGMFRDVEGPKYRMLEREEQLARHERLHGSFRP
jgi:hypothetical protein